MISSSNKYVVAVVALLSAVTVSAKPFVGTPPGFATTIFKANDNCTFQVSGSNSPVCEVLNGPASNLVHYASTPCNGWLIPVNTPSGAYAIRACDGSVVSDDTCSLSTFFQVQENSPSTLSSGPNAGYSSGNVGAAPGPIPAPTPATTQVAAATGESTYSNGTQAGPTAATASGTPVDTGMNATAAGVATTDTGVTDVTYTNGSTCTNSSYTTFGDNSTTCNGTTKSNRSLFNNIYGSTAANLSPQSSAVLSSIVGCISVAAIMVSMF